MRKEYAKYKGHVNKIDTFLDQCQGAILARDLERVLDFFFTIKNIAVDLKYRLKNDKELVKNAQDNPVVNSFSLVGEQGHKQVPYNEELMLVLIKVVEKQVELLHGTFQVSAGHSFDLKVPAHYISIH